jgi:hypothetical protein
MVCRIKGVLYDMSRWIDRRNLNGYGKRHVSLILEGDDTVPFRLISWSVSKWMCQIPVTEV